MRGQDAGNVPVQCKVNHRATDGGEDVGEGKARGNRGAISASAALSAGLFNTGANLIALKAEWQNINLDEWICITVLPSQSITIYASG